MGYRIGLDIGVASVGWCLLLDDNNGEPYRIKNLGVRTFETAEVPKTGKSTAAERRGFRSLRRLKRRRCLRRDDAKSLFKNALNIEFIPSVNVLELRAAALEKKISSEEFCCCMLNILSRRGYQSSRKSDKKKKDEGALLTSTKENNEILKKYRSVGEMLYKDEKFNPIINGEKFSQCRNKMGDYGKTILRSDLITEIKLLFALQRQFGNNCLTEKLENDFLEIFTRQRPFDVGPGFPSQYAGGFQVGNCSFETNEKRAQKASFTFEYFSALSKINNLKVLGREGTKELTKDEKQLIITKAKNSKTLTYNQIRKLLKLDEENYFNDSIYSNKKTQEECEKEYVYLFHILTKFERLAKKKRLNQAMNRSTCWREFCL